VAVLIRDFLEADRQALREIYVASRRHAFPWLDAASLHPLDFDRDTDRERVLVASLDGGPVGFASIWEPEDFLHNLFLHPAVIGRGLGRRLLSSCLPLFRGPPTLKCLKQNTNAVGFYLHHGWRVLDEGTSADGVYLRMTLDHG
jgi:GNAT superfamily N-acetyltransferase